MNAELKTHPTRMGVTREEMNLLLVAAEFGFRECEKGRNLQRALENISAMFEVTKV